MMSDELRGGWVLTYKLADQPEARLEFRDYEAADAIYQPLHDAAMQRVLRFDHGPTLTIASDLEREVVEDLQDIITRAVRRACDEYLESRGLREDPRLTRDDVAEAVEVSIQRVTRYKQ